eukprot:CAMPEP_0185027828 /NCGR_PEP_ID=MMETSP1103-20130426/13085_1 /TAXON_ID=36769 /ORGANISM="Paraphysomonas bandaiensis, Strain Caron Lab Isolate" /LENGTH=414 /DNA_ID=CAMNT_0027561973 /DNA_START=15 /DNA_END=1259 /DNA_ORIENTATION=-
MTRRIIEEIYPRIVHECQSRAPEKREYLDRLAVLKSSLESGSAGSLSGFEESSVDHNEWQDILHNISCTERNWLDAPWIVSEFYFYRRVVDAVDYFSTSFDPFKQQKLNGLTSSLGDFENLAHVWSTASQSAATVRECISFGILTSLWGNRNDLSLWPADMDTAPTSSHAHDPSFSLALGSVYETLPSILDNHLEAVTEYLAVRSIPNDHTGDDLIVNIIVDNAGCELLSDLFLGHILLSVGAASRVIFRTKAHPTFVSDATSEDCEQTVALLCGSSAEMDTQQHAHAMGQLWREHLLAGRFVFAEDGFWCQPTGFKDMPPRVRDLLSGSQLVIVKGDANYRRLLDDRLWPYCTPFSRIVGYSDTPLCALRALKSEVACGIPAEISDDVAKKESNWMVSGKYAVVQYFDPFEAN